MDAKAYAEHRGVSKAMVTKYLQNGFIPSAKQIGRKWYIDEETTLTISPLIMAVIKG